MVYYNRKSFIVVNIFVVAEFVCCMERDDFEPLVLPRNAQLNFSESNDYDDLIASAGAVYGVPVLEFVRERRKEDRGRRYKCRKD